MASLTKIETDALIIHSAHTILSEMFTSVEALVQSAMVFDGRDKKAALKCIQDRKAMIMVPSLLTASILNPVDKGSNLTNVGILTGMEYIFNSAKSIGLDEASVMTQLTDYRGKLGIWSNEFVWAGCGNVAPTTWWKAFYAHADFGIIAERILTTPLTFAATERSCCSYEEKKPINN